MLFSGVSICVDALFCMFNDGVGLHRMFVFTVNLKKMFFLFSFWLKQKTCLCVALLLVRTKWLECIKILTVVLKGNLKRPSMIKSFTVSCSLDYFLLYF